MEFLHDGRPPVIRQARYAPQPAETLDLPAPADAYHEELLAILGSLNVASKEWVIRQYDHEVQAGSVIKPLVGAANDGPGDAAVVRPKLTSRRGIAVSCGMNPYYGDLNTYHMAASSIDEAMRNCVAVGADPRQIAILDNFCWGDCENPETLGSLVLAALACYDLAVELETPFISGKDSLNNEFSYVTSDGEKQTIAIPATLLISAMGQVESVDQCVTMDLKKAGNVLYLVGITRDELGGSHYAVTQGRTGGRVPQVHVATAKATFLAIHDAIKANLVQACHDLSEGGLAVASAEMAFAGSLGATLHLARVPHDDLVSHPVSLLFSESNSRFLCEVAPDRAADFEAIFDNIAENGPLLANIGEVTATNRLQILTSENNPLIDVETERLKAAWQKPLAW